MRALVRISLLLIGSLDFAAGCVDTTPREYVPRHRDGGGETGDVDGAVRDACRRCVTDPGAPCRAEYETCAADARCVAFTECLFDLGCFSLPELQLRIACGKPCFDRVGIAASNDPALTHALPVNGCTSPGNACGDVCVALGQ